MSFVDYIEMCYRDHLVEISRFSQGVTSIYIKTPSFSNDARSISRNMVFIPIFYPYKITGTIRPFHGTIQLGIFGVGFEWQKRNVLTAEKKQTLSRSETGSLPYAVTRSFMSGMNRLPMMIGKHQAAIQRSSLLVRTGFFALN